MTTRSNRAYPAGTRRPGARPRTGGLVHISEVLARICGCGGTATVLFEARSADMVRKIQACPKCAPKARAWAARAGPVHETRLATGGEAETGDTETLF